MNNLYEVRISTFQGNAKVTQTVEAHARCSIDALVNSVRALNLKEGACHAYVKPVVQPKVEVPHA